MDVRLWERAAVSRKRILRVGGDIREHPRYSVNEAAAILNIPPTTLHSWISSDSTNHHPLITLVDEENSLLSFYNLVEAHVLVSTRRRKVPMSRVRIAVEYLQEKVGGPHPLASYQLATSEKSMFI